MYKIEWLNPTSNAWQHLADVDNELRACRYDAALYGQRKRVTDKDGNTLPTPVYSYDVNATLESL